MKQTDARHHLELPGSSPARLWGILLRITLALILLLTFAASSLHAQEDEPFSGPEGYKFRISGQFWYATPIVSIAGSSSENQIDFNKDFGFQEYSTFNAGLDWHFKRKHHLLFIVSPNETQRSAILQQNITFRGKTFLAGSSTKADLRTYSFAPGYRYDIFHHPTWHVGIVAQMNLLDIEATITGSLLQPGQITTGSGSGSVFAPLPVFGPEGRFYFAKNHAFVDANVKGMYFFGYGNFISTQGSAGVLLTHNISLFGGYEMGSRLVIKGTSDRLSVRSTQRGPVGGLEFNF